MCLDYEGDSCYLMVCPVYVEGGELSVCAANNPLSFLFIVSSQGMAVVGKTPACLLALGKAQAATVLKWFDLSFAVLLKDYSWKKKWPLISQNQKSNTPMDPIHLCYEGLMMLGRINILKGHIHTDTFIHYKNKKAWDRRKLDLWLAGSNDLAPNFANDNKRQSAQ